jgi:hypothetical protein
MFENQPRLAAGDQPDHNEAHTASILLLCAEATGEKAGSFDDG